MPTTVVIAEFGTCPKFAAMVPSAFILKAMNGFHSPIILLHVKVPDVIFKLLLTVRLLFTYALFETVKPIALTD